LLSHFGSKKDYRDKGEQWAEQIPVMWDEHEIIIKNDLFDRDVIAGESWHFFLDVENNKDEQDQSDGKEERGKELPDDISVQLF